MVGTAAGAEVPWKWGHAAPTLALGVRAAPGPAGSRVAPCTARS